MEVIVNKYKQILFRENQKYNLVSRKTIADEIDKHIEDSLALLNFASINKQEVIDIGTGAGFPGLILAMQCHNSHFTLLEADLKKSGFLNLVGRELQLKNISILRERAEVLGQDSSYREKFTVCTSRAVAETRIILEYGLPLLAIGGTMFLWKGPRYNEEISQAQTALELLGGKIEDCYEYDLADANKRVIIKIIKTASTPAKYPRRPGIPNKRPL